MQTNCSSRSLKIHQVNCGIGRDSVEAWGRKKRSVASSGKQVGDDMTLSREILVLDLKEKDQGAASVADELNQADPSTAQKSPLRSAELANSPQEVDGLGNRHCLSSQSLFVLICSMSCFFVLYVCVVAYFFARRQPRISPIKHQFH